MILVINAGSSNIKYAIYDQNNLTLELRAQISTLDQLFSWLDTKQDEYNIKAIGHRIVHGGEQFSSPTILTAEAIENLKTLIPLAPLHLPNNISAVEYIAQKYPHMRQVACFDTTFHLTQQQLAKIYAIPNNETTRGIIGYGFHGLSYEYIASILQTDTDFAKNSKVIVAHLGSGASMCAIQNGKSVATTMGFSALDGLMMATRCGSIDPGILLYLMQEKNLLQNNCQTFYTKNQGC